MRSLWLGITVLASSACAFEGSSQNPDADEPDAAVASCAPTPAGVVRWWDGESLGVDISSAGQDATPVGAPVTVPGLVGNAMRFGVSDVLLVETPPTPAQFTIEGWVFLDSALPEDWIGIYGRFTEASFTSFDDRLAFWDGTFGGVDGNLAVSTTSLAGAWRHSAVTWDGTEIRSYVDGELEATETPGDIVALPANPSGIGGLIAGAANDQIQDPLVGLIDELTIYDNALSGADITAIASAMDAGKCK